jgi:hypothetical protein
MSESELDRLKNRLQMFYDAESAILLGQEYHNGSFSLRRADLGMVESTIKDLERRIKELESSNRGKRCAFRITPRDL